MTKNQYLNCSSNSQPDYITEDSDTIILAVLGFNCLSKTYDMKAKPPTQCAVLCWYSAFIVLQSRFCLGCGNMRTPIQLLR